MSQPLQNLSPAKQNSRLSPVKIEFDQKFTFSNPFDEAVAGEEMSLDPILARFQDNTADDLNISPLKSHNSPLKPRSPVKYRLQEHAHAIDSQPGSPAETPVAAGEETPKAQEASVPQEDINSEALDGGAHVGGRSTTTTPSFSEPKTPDGEDETEITLSIDRTLQDDTVGDLSTISAIPADMTRFANLRNSPTKTPRDAWSPTKQMRNSVIMGTPGTVQRPLHLLSGNRHSNSSNEDVEATPRARGNSTSPADLMDFTGQSNILIPPPGSATRPIRRTPSGRGAFPIRLNPTPSHRSHASVDRERSAGRPIENGVLATPADKRRSMYGMPTGFGSDLLDLDLEPMATPRSIPTITPRELETLRSELQSKISGLEATLSGKEAEVMALKRAVTDAEVRVGKTSEDLRNERAAKEAFEQQRDETEASNRQMEEMLRELKQNAFVDERERDKLRRQAEEAERRVEEHEVKVLELNASLNTLRSERIKNTPSPEKSLNPSTPGYSTDVDRAVKEATETVARELHALYKSKHERKVADLKLSYEKRWQKQVDQLRADLQLAQDEIMKFQTEREATMSGVVPGQSEMVSKMEGQIEELRRWNDEISGDKKVLEAEIVGVKGKMEKIQVESDHLRKELEVERAEKGDLVAQVDLFLTMSTQAEQERQLQQQEAETPKSQPTSPRKSDDGVTTVQVQSPSKFRTSGAGVVAGGTTGRPRPQSMLLKPTAGYSKLPGPGASGLKAPSKLGGPGYHGGRSGGLLDGIARMGAGGR